MRGGCDILIILEAMRCRIRRKLSGRSAAWLARLVRDQEVEGSNPFAPTTLILPSHVLTHLRRNRFFGYLMNLRGIHFTFRWISS
jgi:hypothetical protein